MRGADELAHQIKHQSQQQAGDYAPFVYGHVASYDPKTHSIRAVLPAMRDEGGNPILSGWMPLGTSMAGNGIGIQMAPMGGASIENPTKGELVKISRFDRSLGVGFVDGFMFNQVAVPPVQDLEGGEIAIVAHGGSLIRFRSNQDIEFSSKAKMTINALADVEINAQNNCKVAASGNLVLSALGALTLEAALATVNAAGGTAGKLVTDALVALFNTHTHAQTIGHTGPPDQQMDATQLTTVLEAQ